MEGTRDQMDMATERTDHDVTLRIQLAEDCDRDELEGLAVTVLEIVEAHASHIAHDPVVSGTFGPPVIELDCDMEAASRAELFALSGELLGIIEQHAPLRCVTGASVAERDPVPA
jgi:hypothetical protein